MKLLKLLAQKMDKEEQKCLPLLLNCFYYRETLFIVYELLRDNLYHMYARADPTAHARTYSAPALAVRVNTRLNSRLTSCRVPATNTSTSAVCQSTSRCAPQPAFGGAPPP